jgi:hypothetical protein
MLKIAHVRRQEEDHVYFASETVCLAEQKRAYPCR